MQPSLAQRRLRTLVRRWPGVVETQSWGHPNGKRGGRQFASFDTYGGRASICFMTTLDIQARLVLRPHFLLAPYAAGRGWVCRTLDEPLDWTELASLLRDGYGLITAAAGAKPARKTKRPGLRARRRVPGG
jgi:predicted DNA-binding protein (MmcQ/YjbR family)